LTRILLVRHGESEFNNTHRFAGHVDIGLTETGRRQVERLHDRLAGEKIDAVYCSDLRRARITAEIVTAGRDMKITECPELREISYGDIEGLTFTEIQQKYPVLADQIHRSDLTMAFPGGESFTDFVRRVESFKKRLVNHTDSESVLVAAHGGPLRTLLLSLLGLSQECWWQLRIDNASLSILDIYPPLDTNLKAVDNIAKMPQRVILSLFNEISFLTETPKYKPPPLSSLQQQAEVSETEQHNKSE
jgi:alpha-ribazole phosphatase